jgi:3-phosphoshikimate 1-carboxyvinyltransferase
MVPPVAFDTYDDHRMAMSLALVSLRRNGITINDPQCVAKTYPNYWHHWHQAFLS